MEVYVLVANIRQTKDYEVVEHSETVLGVYANSDKAHTAAVLAARANGDADNIKEDTSEVVRVEFEDCSPEGWVFCTHVSLTWEAFDVDKINWEREGL